MVINSGEVMFNIVFRYARNKKKKKNTKKTKTKKTKNTRIITRVPSLIKTQKQHNVAT